MVSKPNEIRGTSSAPRLPQPLISPTLRAMARRFSLHHKPAFVIISNPTMTIETSRNEGDTSALARRRRKARLSRKNENDKRLREEDEEPEEVVSGPRKKPHITGIKRQARYDPGVPMTRDELTSWRKEARRVRNRESAAASRQRTREKIDELEDKLASLSSKYAAALKRIAQLEAGVSTHSIVPTTVSQEDSRITQVSPISSPHLASVSPASSPRSSFSLDDSHHQVQVEQKYQHIMNMITRPAA